MARRIGGGGGEIQDWGTCPTCGKVAYPTRKRAKEVAKKVYPGYHLSPYQCGDFWHIGNLPRAVVRGADRATLRPAKKREPAKRTSSRRKP